MTAPAPPLIVAADTIARRAGLARPLDENTRWAIEEAIRDAQSDVEAYLGRPITPQTATETGLWPVSGGSLMAPGSWFLANVPALTVVSATPETWGSTPIGTYTVTYTYGLDAATDPTLHPIRRWVTAAAGSSPAVTEAYERENPATSRVITSVSAEGQSISYGAVATPGATTGGAPGSGVPGSVPLLSSLDRWRLAGRRVYQRPTSYVEDRYWG